MLAGNVPYVTSNDHPDEMLSARLALSVGQSLIHQDLEFLSSGLEGRSTNPVSLLLDSLTHPCADIGLEIEPLIEWRRNGVEVSIFECCFVITVYLIFCLPTVMCLCKIEFISLHLSWC